MRLWWSDGGLVGGPLRRPAVVEPDDTVRRLQRLGVQRVDVGRVEVGAVVERVILPHTAVPPVVTGGKSGFIGTGSEGHAGKCSPSRS